MVNVFLTSSPHDIDLKTGHKGYRISASNLDKSRLWKQVLEALQILNLISSLKILGDMFKLPCPNNPYKVKEWINDVMGKYKKLNYYLFLHQGQYLWFKKSYPKPKKIRYDEIYEILDNGSILYNGKEYPKYSLVLPGDNFFSMGFYSHPAVTMWNNYPESLKLYINDHIDEFISRGGKKGVDKLRCKIDFPINEISHPIFALDPHFHKNHKAALTTKEVVRNEPKWYYNKRDFKVAYRHYVNKKCVIKSTSDFGHYIWVFTQDRNEPIYKIVEKEDGTCDCYIK